MTLWLWSVAGWRGYRCAGLVELDAGLADAAAGAGAAERSSDGLGVRAGGVGVGVRANRGEVVGRGVLVGEGVDRDERGLCACRAAPALGLFLAAGAGRRLPGKEGLRRGRAVRPSFEVTPGRVGNRNGMDAPPQGDRR